MKLNVQRLKLLDNEDGDSKTDDRLTGFGDILCNLCTGQSPSQSVDSWPFCFQILTNLNHITTRPKNKVSHPEQHFFVFSNKKTLDSEKCEASSECKACEIIENELYYYIFFLPALTVGPCWPPDAFPSPASKPD